MSDKMTQAIEKAYANMETAVFQLKDGKVEYGKVRTMDERAVGLMDLITGELIIVFLCDIYSFARCDNRYTV